MDTEEVLDYVMATPYNTNRAVLRGMLRNMDGGGSSGLMNLVDGTAEGSVRGISTAEDDQSYQIGINAIAVGEGTKAKGKNSFAEGTVTLAQGIDSHAEGKGSSSNIIYCNNMTGLPGAIGDESHVEGIYCLAYHAGGHAEGNRSLAYYSYTHAEGNTTVAYGECSHAEGYDNISYGYAAHAEGQETRAGRNINATSSVNFGQHAEGQQTQALGEASHAEGIYTIASGMSSHAEGQGHYQAIKYTTQLGSAAAAILPGVKSPYSHVEGYQTLTNENTTAVHAEGYQTIAGMINGGGQPGDHAEGYATYASGGASHAEGDATKALGVHSHAEGSGTTASSSQSHAEGSGTTASGAISHAEGNNTTASGSVSHAEGDSTIAAGNCQHVFGKFNIEETRQSTSDPWVYVEIVGNGTKDSARSNARTLDWRGNEELAGSLTLGKGTADEVTITAAQLKQLINMLS